MNIDQLLTSTRSARRTLDLDAPVDLDEVADCLRIALHAANGTNQQSWRLERRDDRWAIAARLCLVEWRTELPSLLTGPALDAIAASGTIARDRTDSSYARPLAVRRPEPGAGT